MPRIRSLKPDVWEDERFGTLGPRAQLLFIGLITQADDEGFLRGHPSYIKGQVFPYHDLTSEDVQVWLDEIQAAGMIRQYGSPDGLQRYIQILNWAKHQRVRDAKNTTFPRPHRDLPTRRPNENTAGDENTSVAGESDTPVVAVSQDCHTEEEEEGKGRGLEEARATPTEQPFGSLAAQRIAAVLTTYNNQTNKTCNTDTTWWQEQFLYHHLANKHVTEAEWVNAIIGLDGALRSGSFTLDRGREWNTLLKRLRWMTKDAAENQPNFGQEPAGTIEDGVDRGFSERYAKFMGGAA